MVDNKRKHKYTNSRNNAYSFSKKKNSISQKDWLFRTCRQFQEWILESVIKIIVF